MTMFELFMKGGIIMYPILVSSIIAFVVIIERFIVLRRANTDAGQFMMRLRSVLQRNDIISGVNFCAKSQAPIANILRKGLTVFPDGHERVRESIEGAGKEETFKLEHRLGILASIAGIAPLMGFLGTVVGMIGAFRTVQLLHGNVNPSDLAGGIWEALITTAFGLTVGIIAYGFYNYFVTKVGRLVNEMEMTSEEFIDLVRSGKLDDVSGEDFDSPRSSRGEDEYFRKKG